MILKLIMSWCLFTGMHTYGMHGRDRVLCIIKSMFMDTTRHPTFPRPSARIVKRLGSIIVVSSNVLARNKAAQSVRHLVFSLSQYP
jgi:hypothetical protein